MSKLKTRAKPVGLSPKQIKTIQGAIKEDNDEITEMINLVKKLEIENIENRTSV